jgi:nucleotide-binding universal stress UspA family protein
MPETGEVVQAARYERIVVPLDGSDVAERALPHAETLTRALDLPLHLVRVVDTSAVNLLGAGFPVEQASVAVMFDAITAEQDAAREHLETVARQLEGRVRRASVEVRAGFVVTELLAALRPGDLMVLTTHGRSGIARLVFGSVAEGVVRRSSVPVLLVRTHTADDEKDGART